MPIQRAALSRLLTPAASRRYTDFAPAQTRARQRQHLPPRLRVPCLHRLELLQQPHDDVRGFRERELLCFPALVVSMFCLCLPYRSLGRGIKRS